jgi:hypothetical protein
MIGASQRYAEPMRAAICAVLLLNASACWPGRCEGGLRALLPLPSKGESIAVQDHLHAYFGINLDTNLKSGPDVLAASGLDASSVLLEGPAGAVPLTIEASVNSSAHSCASAGSLTAKPAAPLVAGDYTFVVLLDKAKWKPVDDDDATTWRGQRAMTRRYTLK